MSDKRLASRIPQICTNHGGHNSHFLMEKIVSRRFTKGFIATVNKHMERCTSLVIREMHIKTTVKYHCIPSTVTRSD